MFYILYALVGTYILFVHYIILSDAGVWDNVLESIALEAREHYPKLSGVLSLYSFKCAVVLALFFAYILAWPLFLIISMLK